MKTINISLIITSLICIAVSFFSSTQNITLYQDNSKKVNSEIVKWAYKNAAPCVPITEIKRIVKETDKYRNKMLLLALIAEESEFNMYARSHIRSKNFGAKGLGQIITKTNGENKWPGWLPELIEQGIWEKEIDVFDIKKNIRATNYILNKYYKSTHNWPEVLNKYVNNSKDYVRKVMNNLDILHSFGEDDVTNTKVPKG